MRKILCACVVITTILASAIQGYSDDKAEAKAQAMEASLLWMALVDQGLYEQSWTSTHKKFRDAVSKEQWLEQLDLARKPLGQVKSREIHDSGYFDSIPEHPGMEMIVFQFKTSFENKEIAIETISSARDNKGPWTIAGYYIADSIDVKVH